MRFIYHDDGVFTEEWVELHFLQKDSISHYFYFCFDICVILKAHFVSDNAGLHVEHLLGNELAYREDSNSTRLGDADSTTFIVSCFMKNEWQLGSFPRSGGAFDNNDVMVRERAKNFVFLRVDGQLLVTEHDCKLLLLRVDRTG